MSFTPSSPSFADQGSIPRRLVLNVDDPDAPDPAAPKLTWVHWLLDSLPIAVCSPSHRLACADAR
jgi:phosphatidylethanolamine-binding protein (PEBP) family uncharacterized protein